VINPIPILDGTHYDSLTTKECAGPQKILPNF
jgi:hypothetical protein